MARKKGRGKKFTEKEFLKAKAMLEVGIGQQKVADILKRSRSVIHLVNQSMDHEDYIVNRKALSLKKAGAPKPKIIPPTPQKDDKATTASHNGLIAVLKSIDHRLARIADALQEPKTTKRKRFGL